MGCFIGAVKGLVAPVGLTENVFPMRFALKRANLAPYSPNVAGLINAAELLWAALVYRSVSQIEFGVYASVCVHARETSQHCWLAIYMCVCGNNVCA